MMWAQAGSPLTAAVVAVHKGRCCSAAGDIRSYSRRPAAALSATKRCSSRRMKTSAFAGEEKSAAAPTAEPKAAQQQQQGGGRKRAVIAGAGPAGSLAALYLAKQGWHVTVCDRRGSATEAFTSADILAYNIGLNDRGILVRALVDFSPCYARLSAAAADGTSAPLTDAAVRTPVARFRPSTTSAAAIAAGVFCCVAPRRRSATLGWTCRRASGWQ